MGGCEDEPSIHGDLRSYSDKLLIRRYDGFQSIRIVFSRGREGSKVAAGSKCLQSLGYR